jgi:hypothetical protein
MLKTTKKNCWVRESHIHLGREKKDKL